MNDKAGLTFSVALKAFLRQDPDIIMVGEIRDLETGEIAIKAAQTGHMVLSTLHTKDAPSTLTRLNEHGHRPVQHRLLGDPHHGAAAGAQALHLQAAVAIPEEALLRAGFTEDELDGTWQTYEAVGARCARIPATRAGSASTR